MKIINLSDSQSITNQYLCELRDKSIQPDRMRFVKNVERIGQVLAYEISKELEYKNASVQTKFNTSEAEILKNQPVIATILRAGVPFHNGFLQIFDKADSSFVAAARRLDEHNEMKSEIGYVACPKLDGRPLIIVDPMIATGATMVDAYRELLKYGQPSKIFFASIVIAKPTIKLLEVEAPEATLYTAAIDPSLNDDFFIVPGIGDVGDTIYGEKASKK